MEKAIERLHTKKGIFRFISGMAIGFDMLAAEVVIELREFGKLPIQLIAAIPFPSQASLWPMEVEMHWKYLCKKADSVKIVNPDPYSSQKMFLRNKWMVDQSSFVLTYWESTEKGGTYSCLDYAIRSPGIEKILNVHGPKQYSIIKGGK
jgi:uncharacterized phage-like protein YoqJ